MSNVMEEFINMIERMGCVNIVEYVREHKINWVEIRGEVRRQLRARGYTVNFKGVWMCISKSGDPADKIAELLIQEGCVHKRKIMNLYGITGEEWKRVKRKVVKILATRGFKVYKHGNWTYCIEGARPSKSPEMTIPLFVKIDAETMAKLEELSKKKGVSKAEIVREAIAEYLRRVSAT